MQSVPESHVLQHACGAFPARFRVDSRVNKRELDVPQAVRARKKVKRLKNKSDLAVANGCQFIIVHHGNVSAVEFIAAGIWRIEASKLVPHFLFAPPTP